MYNLIQLGITTEQMYCNRNLPLIMLVNTNENNLFKYELMLNIFTSNTEIKLIITVGE